MANVEREREREIGEQFNAGRGEGGKVVFIGCLCYNGELGELGVNILHLGEDGGRGFDHDH